MKRLLLGLLISGLSVSVGTIGALAGGSADSTGEGFHCYLFFELADGESFAQVMINDSNSDVVVTKLNESRGSADRKRVLSTMLPYLNTKPDVAIGKKLFEKTCMICHKIGGNGGPVGPNLTGIGARAAKDILAEIVDPNRSLESNFRLWKVETKDGEDLSGRLDTETRTSIELLDLQGKRHVIQRKDIERLIASPLSVMPVGLIDQFTPKQVSSLIEFLRQSAHKE